MLQLAKSWPWSRANVGRFDLHQGREYGDVVHEPSPSLAPDVCGHMQCGHHYCEEFQLKMQFLVAPPAESLARWVYRPGKPGFLRPARVDGHGVGRRILICMRGLA